MHPAAGAILWAASSEAGPNDLDLHVSATHLSDPAQSPTVGAIVLAVAVTQPESTGRAVAETELLPGPAVTDDAALQQAIWSSSTSTTTPPPPRL